MAGYDYSRGMSNNAVAAYENGLVPASKIGGIPAKLVTDHCRYEEWHHSSKAFNKVNFYNASCVKVQFGLLPDGDCACGHCAPNPAAIAALAAYKSGGTVTHVNCRVEWIEWSGSLTRPVANPRTAEGCTVAIKGQTATVTFANNRTMVKRLSTKGFRFRAVSAEL